MKKVLIGLAVFLVVLVVGVLVAPSFIDWQGYRDEIAQKVKEVTGRDLTIKGEIGFSLLPSPKLSVSDLHFSNADGASHADMVELRQLDVRVALMPLLAGNVHINSLHMIEPTIRLEVLPNQQGNWILKSGDEPAKNIETPVQSDDPRFAVDQTDAQSELPIQIDDFIIEKGRLIYQDPANNVYEEIADLNSRFALGGITGPYEAAGTMNLRGIPLGFEVSVGQIIHGRTASFASQITLAHGATSARISGTVVSLNEVPKVKSKIDVTGASLAGLISAFDKSETLPGALDRPFKLSGDFLASAESVRFEGDGLDLSLGEDHGRVQLDATLGSVKTAKLDIHFGKIDGDIWLNAAPYKVIAPEPLALVIKPTSRLVPKMVVDEPVKAAESKPKSEAVKTASLPRDVEAEVSLNVDAITLKGDAVRQLQTRIALSAGEIALERLSAILPGAGEFTLVGVAGDRQGSLQFDGSMDLNLAHLRGGLAWAGVDVAGVPSDRLQQLSLETQISATPEQVNIVGLKAKMDGSTLSGGASIAMRARPSFGLGLLLDRINLDAYVPTEKTPTSPTPSNATLQEQPASPKTQSPTKAPSAALDALKLLNQFDANLDLAVGELTYQKRTIKNAKVNATIYNGDLDIKQATVADFAGLNLGLSGKIMGKDSSILAENLAFKASGKDLSGAAQIAGLASTLDWQKLGTVSLSATLNDNLLAPDLDVNLGLLGANVILSGRADIFPLPKLDATLNAQISDFQRLMRGIAPAYRPQGNPGAIDISTDLDYNVNQISLKNIAGHIGKTEFGGEALYKMTARPYLDVNVKTGVLRLDPFMVSDGSSSGSSEKTSSSQSGGTSSGSASQSSSQRWSRTPIDLSALAGMDGKIHIENDGLLYKKIRAEKIVHTSDMKDGVLNVSDVIGNIFGGQLTAQTKLAIKDKTNVDIILKGTGIKVADALAQTGSEASADGRFDVSANLTTVGKSEWDFVNGLNGTGVMDLKKVSVGSKGKGASALDILNFLAVLSGTSPDKGLADVALASTITNGVADLTRAQLTSNIASGSADGVVNLPNWTMDIKGKLNIQQNALVGLLAQKAKMKQEYPFTLRGPIDSPDVKLDTGGLASGGGLIIPLPDKLEKNGVGNLLRGIIGGGKSQNTAPTQAAPAPTTSDDGTVAPPPPVSSGSTQQQKQPSVEQQLLQGLGQFLKNK